MAVEAKTLHIELAEVEAEEIAALLRRNGRLADPTATDTAPLAHAARVQRLPGTGAPQGLRQAILALLEAADRGYRPSEMTNALEARAFKEVGEPTTPLSIRVGNELARLARENQITKDGLGRYISLKKAARLGQLTLDESTASANGHHG